MSAGNASLSGSATKQEHYHAFLSHNGDDKPLVEALANELENRRISCWLDKWNLVPGDPWQPAIEAALGQCDTCVVFFGPRGLGPWHNEEMRLAIQRRVNSRERKLRVLPVILPGGQRAKESDVPGFLQGTTWVEFRKSIDEEDALHRLLCGIKGVPPGRGPGAIIVQGECPYLGLKTFQPDDAPLFFGRTAKIQELVGRLGNNFGTPGEGRFLALIGASGSGKSSLALAGLIPSIQRGELPDSANWPLIRFRPGYRPWENLQLALANNSLIGSHLAALPALITRIEDEQRRLHLTAQLALHNQPETHRLFVLIDQFEEIFTLCNEEATRRQLIDNVLDATSVTQGRTIVVLTMRADFYGQCATYPGLRAAISDHQSLIGPLSEQELREAIESPARLAGGELEPALMELLLDDMKGQPGALPFLEHALFKLWEKREGRRLTAKTYTEMGRLQGALDAHAEEFFTKNLSTEEQTWCRHVLVDLVRPGEGAADTKKRVSVDDIAPTDAARAVLIKLTDARLVTTGRDDRPEAAQAELAHEALISGWRRLGDWVNENREKSRLKERLLESAREWQKNSKKEDFLYRGIQLAAAEQNFSPSPESLPKLGSEFLEASIATRDRERQERRREQRNRQRLLATAVAVFAVLAVAATSAAIFGFWQKGEAERQRAVAQKEAERALQAEQKANERKEEAQKQQRIAIDALQSAKQQAELARKAEDGARTSEEKAREAASQANFSLARYSQEAGDDTYALQHLARALRLNPRNYAAAAFAGAILSQTKWPLPLGRPMVHGSAVRSAQFSADGHRVLTASEDGTARVWDVGTGEELGQPIKHPNWIVAAQFSPDGQRVATASWDSTARLWDALTGQPIGDPMKHGGFVNSVQFSPDGRRVATTSWDGTARLWDALTGRPLGQPMKHVGLVNSAQFSPDGQRVVTASANLFTEDADTSDGSARVWDAATGKLVADLMKHGGFVNSAQFSPDGQRIVTAFGDGAAQLWDAATGTPVGEPMKHGKGVLSAQFSPDGQRVLTASEDGTARLWDGVTGEEIGEPVKHEREVNSAQFSPNGQLVVTASQDGTARLWDALVTETIDEPLKHGGGVFSAEFSPDGQRVVTASEDGTARLWDAANGRPIGQPIKHGGWVDSAQFSPDGRQLVTASSDGTARLWDVLGGKAIGALMLHEKGVTSAVFSPDGQRVVTASADGTVRLWDATSGKEVAQPIKPDGWVDSAQVSPDGHRLVTASGEAAKLWDAATGKMIGQPMKHGGRVRSARFSPDGQRVVTASDDKTARLWNALTGEEVGEPMKHGNSVNSAEFSPDGYRVVTASADGARVWDTATGKEIGVPLKHGLVNSARFSPDGQRVATTSWDDTARLWDVPTPSAKDTADDVLLLADLAEATAGSYMKASGGADIRSALTAEQIKTTREKIAAKFAGRASNLTALQRFLQWSVSEWRSRPISPFSKLTVAQWIENRIREGGGGGLRAAIRVDPTNARLAAHFGRFLADYALDEKTDPDTARGARGGADFQTRRAVKLAPDNDEVKKLRAEVVKLLNLPSDPKTIN